EGGRHQDHLALEGVYEMDVYDEGRLVRRSVPLRSAMNEVLRDAYVEDCQKALDRWNRRLAGTGAALVLPSRRFHRHQGTFAGRCFDPDGREIDAGTAAALGRLGVQEEQRVLVVLPDGPECVYAFLGAIWAGAVPVLVSTFLAPPDYLPFLRETRARAVVTTESVGAALGAD